MPAPDLTSAIERKLTERLSPAHLEIVDESARHAGHAGAVSGGGHFRVTVVASAFEGLDRLERHRLVYAILAEEMQGAIHALALRTLDPSEWRPAR